MLVWILLGAIRHVYPTTHLLRCEESKPHLEAFKKLQQAIVLPPDGKSQSHLRPSGAPPCVTGVYFSAHWCPPCREFTPILAKCYEELQALGKPFEVFFVSGDKSESEFNTYFAEMPWKAAPFSDCKLRSELRENFAVESIPTLVLLDPEGCQNRSPRIHQSPL